MMNLTVSRKKELVDYTQLLDKINELQKENDPIYKVKFTRENGVQLYESYYLDGKQILENPDKFELVEKYDVDIDHEYPVWFQMRSYKFYITIIDLIHKHRLFRSNDKITQRPFRELKHACDFCRRKRKYFSCDDHKIMRSYYHYYGGITRRYDY